MWYPLRGQGEAAGRKKKTRSPELDPKENICTEVVKNFYSTEAHTATEEHARETDTPEEEDVYVQVRFSGTRGTEARVQGKHAAMGLLQAREEHLFVFLTSRKVGVSTGNILNSNMILFFECQYLQHTGKDTLCRF